MVSRELPDLAKPLDDGPAPDTLAHPKPPICILVLSLSSNALSKRSCACSLPASSTPDWNLGVRPSFKLT